MSGGTPVHASLAPATKIARIPASNGANFFLDSSSRLLYDVDSGLGTTLEGGLHKGGQTVITRGAGIRFYNADTFAETGDDLDLGRAFLNGPAAVDELDNLLFLSVQPATGPQVLIVDSARRTILGTITASLSAGHQIANLSFDSKSKRLYGELVLAGAGAGVIVVEMDPFAALQGRAAVLSSYPVAQCEQAAAGQSFGRSGDTLYLACSGPVDLAAVHQPDVAQGVYAIPLGSDGSLAGANPLPIFSSLPGSYLHGGATFDPGTGRMILFSRPFGPSGALIFDGPHRALVGIIGQEGDLDAACVDPSTGRFYAVTRTGSPGAQDWGFLIGEARATPSPQGIGIPQFGPRGSQDSPVLNHAMVCDPQRRRAMYLTQDSRPRVAFFYDVVQDNMPAYVEPPAPPDPDLNTSNIPDDPATTRVDYQGSGRSYGLGAVIVGGYANFVLSFVNAPGLADPVTKSSPPVCDPTGAVSCSSLGSNLSPSTRRLTIGSVGLPGQQSTVSVSNFSATAAANGAARDSSTISDMTRNGSQPDGWPYQNMSCATSPGSAPKTQGAMGGTVSCDPNTGRASASGAVSGFLEVPGIVRVTDASSTVSSGLDPARGLVSQAAAVVRGVSIAGGQVEIDDVQATATAQARGTPGSAAASYERRIGRVVVAGQVVCGDTKQACVPEDAVRAINSLPGDNVKASLPSADARQTPGGYQAVVSRDFWEQINEETRNEQSPYDQQVPALRLVIQEDAYQHSALILDLAAPQAEAHRGIQACPECVTSDTSDQSNSGGSGLGGGSASASSSPKLPLLGSLGSSAEPPASGVAPGGSSDGAQGSGSGGAAQNESTPSESGAPSAPAGPSVAASNSSGSDSSGSGGLSVVPRAVRAAGRTVAHDAARTVNGLKVVATSPQRLAKTLLVWVLLAVPIYLASRRRLIRSSQRTV